jgi:hypothetical protein
MNYTVVFDAGRSSYTFLEFISSGGVSYAFTAATALLLVIAVLLVAMRHRLDRRVLVSGLVGLAVVWLLASQWLLPKHTILPRTVGPIVVTGLVRDFVPMPSEGHAEERFCVQTACFHYSDYIQTGGFNHTSSRGGPIREGLPVRVTYAASPGANVILKLEVQK